MTAMLLLAGRLLRVLAFGTLVARANGLKFNLTEIQQCNPVTISFSGSNISAIPASLSILPINSTATFVDLQNIASLSAGIDLTFLPLPAGSDFLVSLDDGTGDNLIPVSDLIEVLPSSTGNSSCLPPPADDVPRHFKFVSDITQCEEMSINYDTSVVFKAPTVRLYNPTGASMLLNNTLDDAYAGIATYLMAFPRGKEIVLLLDDGNAIQETSHLITVGGDAASDTSCLNNSNKGSTSTYTTSNSTGDSTPDDAASANIRVVNKNVIIGSAAGGSVVFLVALSMVVWVVMDRRKRRIRKRQGNFFDPSSMEKGPDNEKASPRVGIFVRPPSNEGIPNPFAKFEDNDIVVNPIYTSNSFSSIKSKKYRGSMASWAQEIPEDQRYPANVSFVSSHIAVEPPSSTGSRLSLESLDIEGMLNMASLQSENYPASRKKSDAAILGRMLPSPSLAVPTPTFLRPETSRRHLRSPSGVPVGPDSVAFSGFSVLVNPFDTRESVTAGFIPEPLRTGDSFRISDGSDVLPAPLRNAGSPTRGTNNAGRVSSDWYGIAR